MLRNAIVCWQRDRSGSGSGSGSRWKNEKLILCIIFVLSSGLCCGYYAGYHTVTQMLAAHNTHRRGVIVSRSLHQKAINSAFDWETNVTNREIGAAQPKMSKLYETIRLGKLHKANNIKSKAQIGSVRNEQLNAFSLNSYIIGNPSKPDGSWAADTFPISSILLFLVEASLRWDGEIEKLIFELMSARDGRHFN